MSKLLAACRNRFRAIAGILVWALAHSFALAACTGPVSITSRLNATPTADAYAELGKWFAQKQDFECAAKAFASGSELNPQSESIAYLWGLSLYSAGKDVDALVPLQRAAQLESSDIRPHLALAAALERMKRIAEAETEWRAALAIDANSSIALEGLSQELLDMKDYTGVVALLNKPGSQAARSPVESLNLGIAFAGMVRLDEAAATLREGLNTTPDSLPIADELAFILMLVGRADEAYAVFDLALEKHPNDEPTQLLFLRTLVTSHSTRAPQLAQQLLASNPNQWEILYLNAVIEARDGSFADARSHLQRSISLNAEYPPSHRALGEALARLGDLPGAKEQFEKAIALGDHEPEVQYDLARDLHSLGDVEGAKQSLSAYQQIKDVQSGKSQAAGKAESGDQAIAAGNIAQAVSLYRDALSSDPDEPLLHYKLAKALEKINDIAGETTELDRAILLDPKLAEAQNQRGYIAARSGQSGQAEALFRAAVQASPSYTAAWINLAATLASEEKWQEAKTAVARVLEIDPENVTARQLGQAIDNARSSP